MTQTPLPILYSFRRCPYAMRARLALMASGIIVELREIVLRDKPQLMLEASPKGTVPVLVLPDQSVIDESREIAEWALGQNDCHKWLAGEHADLIDANDGPFKHALDRYKYPNRYPDECSPSSGELHRGHAAGHCQELDRLLGDQPFLSGDQFGWTDAAIAPFIRQFAHVDRDWFRRQPWPNLIVWLDAFLESDRFAAIMPKLAAWKPGDAPVYFGSTKTG